MKTFLLTICALLIVVPLAYGEISVVYDKTSKEILFIAEDELFFVNDPNHKVEVLPNDLNFYNLEYPHSDYKLQGKRLVLNSKKISEEDIKNEEYIAKKEKEDADNITAKEKLIALGFTEGETEVILNK